MSVESTALSTGVDNQEAAEGTRPPVATGEVSLLHLAFSSRLDTAPYLNRPPQMPSRGTRKYRGEARLHARDVDKWPFDILPRHLETPRRLRDQRSRRG